MSVIEMIQIDQADYEEAAETFMGWCTLCNEFTRSHTEPDAEDYDCPECGHNTVMGAENALLEGIFCF